MEKPIDPRNLLTFKAAADILGVSHTTLGDWVRSGLIETVKMPNSTRRRIPRDRLDEFWDRLNSQDQQVSQV